MSFKGHIKGNNLNDENQVFIIPLCVIIMLVQKSPQSEVMLCYLGYVKLVRQG